MCLNLNFFFFFSGLFVLPLGLPEFVNWYLLPLLGNYRHFFRHCFLLILSLLSFWHLHYVFIRYSYSFFCVFKFIFLLCPSFYFSGLHSGCFLQFSLLFNNSLFSCVFSDVNVFYWILILLVIAFISRSNIWPDSSPACPSSKDQEVKSPLLSFGLCVHCGSCYLLVINYSELSLLRLMDSMCQEVRLGMSRLIVFGPLHLGSHQGRSDWWGGVSLGGFLALMSSFWAVMTQRLSLWVNQSCLHVELPVAGASCGLTAGL